MITPEQLAKTGTEHAEQVALFQWAALTAIALEKQETPDHWRANALRMMFAIPNGDQRGSGDDKEDQRRGAMIAGARLKAEGQRNGVPDVFMAVPRIYAQHPHEMASAGLFIEMKQKKLRRENNALASCSDEQKDWIARLSGRGYRCAVCYGWEHARDTIIDYLT